MKIGELQNFVFRGMLLDSSFADLRDGGIVVDGPASTPAAPIEDRIALDDFSLKIRVSAIQMAGVYRAFHCFENSAREFIAQRLSEKHGAKWWDTQVPTRVRTKVADRKKKETQNKWHTPRGSDDLAYADFGDLADIIVACWADFQDLIPAQDWVRTRFDELERSRNIIAHNNILSDREIDRIEMYLQDWIRQIG